MNTHQAKIDAYLRAVETRLQNRPESVRRDILDGLREHIHESLLAAGGDSAPADAIDRILGELDTPDDFAESPAEPTAKLSVPSSSGQRWFWLAVAFLFINAYGVWKWVNPPVIEVIATQQAQESVENEPVPVESEPLTLRVVEQVDLDANRALTLRFGFNSVPNRELLGRFLTLSSPHQSNITYRLEGPSGTNSVWIRTEPVLSHELHYTLRAGMPSTDPVPPSLRDARGRVVLIPELHLRNIQAQSPSFEQPTLRAQFTSLTDINGIDDYIDIIPPARHTVTVRQGWQHAGLHLTGEFEPGGVYTITFKTGLRAVNGAELHQDITRTVQFPNRAPAIAFDTSGRYLSPRGSLSVPVRLVNREEWTSSLEPVFPNNLVQMALRDGWRNYPYHGPLTRELTGAAIVHTNRMTLTANEITRTHLRLRDLVPEPRGVYWLQAGNQGRLIVITDIGLAARAYPGGTLVWVNSLRTAEPLAGATVRAYARNNQVMAEGVTDASGLVRLTGWNADEQPFILTAQLDDDLSHLDLERAQVPSGPGLSGVDYLQPGGFEAAVFTERGIYRPGETVFMQALLRDDQEQAPPAFPVLFRVRRPDGRVFQDIPVTPDGFGSATATVELPVFLPTGRYAIDLVMPGSYTRIGGTTVALEDFVPPQIRVGLSVPAERARTGSQVEFTVRSEHLFGRAAAGLPVEGGVMIEAVPFQPTQWRGWTFGDPERTFQPVQQELGRHVLDPDGRFDFSAQTFNAWSPPAALRIMHWATVTESGGRPVSAYSYSDLDPYPYYIGIRRAWEGHLRVGETQRVAIVQVQPDGEPVAEGKPLTLSLFRIHWHSVLRQTRQNRYEWQSERQMTLVREDTLAASGEPVDWPFSVDTMGDYMLVVRDPASQVATRLSFAASSPEQSWVSWSRVRPGRVELEWDREHYRPGDTAKLLVRAPFSGNALLTIESDRVRTSRVVTLTANTAELEVPVLADYAPNVYCTLTLIRPAVAESVWNPHRASGSIPLSVQRPGHRLHIETDVPDLQRPQTDMTIRVIVRDEEGQPARGAVTLMAVDEGICSLTDFETPGPASIFNARRALGVTGHDLYHELMPLEDDELTTSQNIGGDQGLALRRRLNPINARRFRPVALWQESVPLDPDGVAAATLSVPEFTGELRVMAVAYNQHQTGSAEQSVPVKRDLIAQPALPRFLAIGDRSDSSVVLYNEGTDPMTVRIRITSGGPLRVTPAGQTIELDAGASAHVPFQLEAGPGPGVALCRIEINGGDLQFSDEIEIAVRPASPMQTETVTRLLRADEAVTLSVPDTWMPATVEHAGSISALPALQLSPALDYLWNYPYGCLEQTVSGLFPLLHADAWIEHALPHASALGDVEARVRSGIHRVLAMQQADGGFAWWPFSGESDNEPSLYATHFLVEAEAAGYRIAPERLAAALGWVRTRLNRDVSLDVDTPAWRRDMSERAYAAHILALGGRPNHGWNARLAEQHEHLWYASRVHVAAALMISGQPRQAVPLLQSVAAPIPRDRIPGHLLNSDTADAALLLSAWLDIDPGNEEVGYLAYYLEERREGGHWGTTYDNAMALLALGKYERMSPPSERDFSGTLSVPGWDPIAISSAEPFQWQHGPGASGHVTITNEGPGDMVIWSRYTGVPVEPPPPASQGVSIRREILNTQGEPIDPHDRAQGELLIVRLTIDPFGTQLDHMVIEDLLPAGWEIENPALHTSRPFPWLPQTPGSLRYSDARDDRMLFFSGAFRQPQTYHYAVRVVTPGTYVWPAASVSGMYEPDICASHGGGEVHVRQ